MRLLKLKKMVSWCQVWWFTPVIPALKRFVSSRPAWATVRPCLKKKKKKRKREDGLFFPKTCWWKRCGEQRHRVQHQLCPHWL
jgi:hypothetical protein